jgi:hypothetical protein
VHDNKISKQEEKEKEKEEKEEKEEKQPILLYYQPHLHKDKFGESLLTLSASFQNFSLFQSTLQYGSWLQLLSKDRFGYTILHHLISLDDSFFAMNYITKTGNNYQSVISDNLYNKEQSQSLSINTLSKKNSTAKQLHHNNNNNNHHHHNIKYQTLLRTGKQLIPSSTISYCKESNRLETEKEWFFTNQHTSLHQYLLYIALFFKHSVIYPSNSAAVSSSSSDINSSTELPQQIQQDSNWIYDYMPPLCDVDPK